jgi:hypothetical protein
MFNVLCRTASFSYQMRQSSCSISIPVRLRGVYGTRIRIIISSPRPVHGYVVHHSMCAKAIVGPNENILDKDSHTYNGVVVALLVPVLGFGPVSPI